MPPVQPAPHPHRVLNDLPEQARLRLQEMREHRFFTSDLSVNEFLLVREAGFQPLGLVMGSSIYYIGTHDLKGERTEELTGMTQALYSARELAMDRMEEEADALGADGVVAVRLTFNIRTWGANVIEFLAIGTAVRSELGEGFRGAEGRPFTSDLSGQDFWTLLRAGYRPLGFVMGNCVYHIGQTASKRPPRESMELVGPTQAFYDARELESMISGTLSAFLSAVASASSRSSQASEARSQIPSDSTQGCCDSSTSLAATRNNRPRSLSWSSRMSSRYPWYISACTSVRDGGTQDSSRAAPKAPCPSAERTSRASVTEGSTALEAASSSAPGSVRPNPVRTSRRGTTGAV